MSRAQAWGADAAIVRELRRVIITVDDPFARLADSDRANMAELSARKNRGALGIEYLATSPYTSGLARIVDNVARRHQSEKRNFFVLCSGVALGTGQRAGGHTYCSGVSFEK